MKVIDLLEKAYIEDIEYIDIFSKDDDGLCGVLHPERWREFLTEKVLNSEVFKFSPNDTSSEPGLNIYIKDEETCKDVYKDKFEKKHDDSVDSLIFAKKELDKVIIKQKSLVDEIKAIFRDGFVSSINLFFRPNETHAHVIVDDTYGRSNSIDLPFGVSDAHILDTINDQIEFLKKGGK